MNTAIIVAGGKGSRMGLNIKKQYIKLKGKMILTRTVEKFETCPEIDEIVIVAPKEDIAMVREELIINNGFKKVSRIVESGKERQDSVYNGLMAVAPECKYVFVHDAARPFISYEAIKRAEKAVKSYGAVIVAVPVKDTIKIVNGQNKVQETPDRSTLWSVQTPQVFKKELLIKAYDKAREDGIAVTDDSMVVEYYGENVHVVMGDYNNIKITTQEDLAIGAVLVN